MHLLVAHPGHIDKNELDLATEAIPLQKHGKLLVVIPGTVRTPVREYVVQDERGAAGVQKACGSIAGGRNGGRVFSGPI